jgi:hypothetical protein
MAARVATTGDDWMRSKVTKLLAGLLMLAAGAAAHAENAIEFSADAVQMAPQRPTMQARIFVGKQGVRTEYQRDGQKFVEIVMADQGRRILLNPQLKQYVEVAGAAGPALQIGGSKPANPCDGMAGVSCRKLGTEDVNGMQTEKWEFTAEQNGRTVKTLHWFDTERRLPIKEIFPDGAIAQLKRVGTDTVGGRTAEKWTMSVTRPDGNSMQSSQWYDPELKIAIREELPGGYLRELRNIKVEKQPDSLFKVPAGYEKVEMPQPGAGGAGMPPSAPPRQ